MLSHLSVDRYYGSTEAAALVTVAACMAAIYTTNEPVLGVPAALRQTVQAIVAGRWASI